MEVKDSIEVLKEIRIQLINSISEMEVEGIHKDDKHLDQPWYLSSKKSLYRLEDLIKSIICSEEKKLDFLNRWISKHTLTQDDKFDCTICGETNLSKKYFGSPTPNICNVCEATAE